MFSTSTLFSFRGPRGADALDWLGDRQLADVGFERQGDVIIDRNGRMVRRLPADVGFQWALREIVSAVYGVARSAD